MTVSCFQVTLEGPQVFRLEAMGTLEVQQHVATESLRDHERLVSAPLADQHKERAAMVDSRGEISECGMAVAGW